MSLAENFKKAQEDSRNLSSRPTNDVLLQLYGLYKQGSEGDVTGSRPNMFDMKGAAKFDAWTKRKGMSNDEAMEAYIKLVEELAGS